MIAIDLLLIITLSLSFFSLGVNLSFSLKYPLREIRSSLKISINFLLLVIIKILYNSDYVEFEVLTTFQFIIHSIFFTLIYSALSFEIRKMMKRGLSVISTIILPVFYLLSNIIILVLDLNSSGLNDLVSIIYILVLSIDLLMHSPEIFPKGYSIFFQIYSLLITLFLIGITPIVMFHVFRFNTKVIYWLNIGSISAIFIWEILIIYISIKGLNSTENKFEEPKISLKMMKKIKLTSKERDILLLILDGYTSKSISERINLSQQTVKNYTHRAYKKIGINNKIGLVNYVKKLKE